MHQLQTGLAAASDGTIQLTDGQTLLTTKLGEISAGAAAARSGIGQISDGIKQISPQMQDLIDGLSLARDFLNEVSANVSGAPDAGFYVPKGAFQDPRLMQAMSYFISKDGHAARLLVFGDTTAYDGNAIGRLDAVIDSTNAALAETTLKGSRVEASGLAAGFRDLHHMIVEDFAIIATFALLFIFIILAMAARWPDCAAVSHCHHCDFVSISAGPQCPGLAGSARHRRLLGGTTGGLRRACRRGFRLQLAVHVEDPREFDVRDSFGHREGVHGDRRRHYRSRRYFCGHHVGHVGQPRLHDRPDRLHHWRRSADRYVHRAHPYRPSRGSSSRCQRSGGPNGLFNLERAAITYSPSSARVVELEALGLLKSESCEAFRPGRTKGVTDASAVTARGETSTRVTCRATFVVR